MYRGVVALLFSLFAICGPSLAQGVEGLHLGYDLEFESYFDNREFSNIPELRFRSGTDFGARLMPSLVLGFGKGSKAKSSGSVLNLGVELMMPYGDTDMGYVSRVMPVIYYGFDNSAWSASAGLFPRSRMSIGSYSTAFFSDDYLFNDNLISGLMGRYIGRDRVSFAEFVCDWEGQRTSETRERFRLLFAGRKYWSWFYAGCNLSVTHFAGQDAAYSTNVVDNILVNPAVGAEFKLGQFDANARLGYLQSLQQDRTYGDGWEAPAMGEVAFSVSRWGLTFEEQFYFGGNLMPFYGGQVAVDEESGEQVAVPYGSLLYTGDPCFSTNGGFYNRASIAFQRGFYRDMLNVRVKFVTHLDSAGFCTEQIVELNVKLNGLLCKERKEHKEHKEHKERNRKR